MSKEYGLPVFRMLVAAAALFGTVSPPVEAAPVKVEAVISPKAESKLEFADGSNRYLLATQREGKATWNGPLAGATMLEWGTHDVTPGIGFLGNGYLVFTTNEGDVAYLTIRSAGFRCPAQTASRRISLTASGRLPAVPENSKACGAPALFASTRSRLRNGSGYSKAIWFKSLKNSEIDQPSPPVVV